MHLICIADSPFLLQCKVDSDNTTQTLVTTQDRMNMKKYFDLLHHNSNQC